MEKGRGRDDEKGPAKGDLHDSSVSVQTNSTANFTPDSTPNNTCNTRERARSSSSSQEGTSNMNQDATADQQQQSSTRTMTTATTTPTTALQLFRQFQHVHPRLQQSILLLATSGAAFSVLLASILPTSAVLALCALVASSMALCRTIYQYLVDTWTSTLHHRGIGAYIPASMYRTLTELSVHEWMTDDAFARQNRHFLLYLFPGLSAEQRTNLIQRLGPRHRQQLLRPGVGHFLGEGFMRVLMGDERWQAPPLVNGVHRGQLNTTTAARRHLQQQQPAVQVVYERNHGRGGEPRRLDYNENDDDSIDIGLNVTENDLVGGGLTDEQATNLGRQLSFQNNNTVATSDTVVGADFDVTSFDNDDVSLESDHSLEYHEEERLLTEAFLMSVSDGFVGPFYRYWTNRLLPVTASLLRASVGLFMASMGMSAWSISRGGHRSPNSAISLGSIGTRQVRLGSLRMFYGFAAFSGIASIGILALRQRLRRAGRRTSSGMSPTRRASLRRGSSASFNIMTRSSSDLSRRYKEC
jgi:hypothetical protein